MLECYGIWLNVKSDILHARVLVLSIQKKTQEEWNYILHQTWQKFYKETYLQTWA